jgi:hypothetical protein
MLINPVELFRRIVLQNSSPQKLALTFAVGPPQNRIGPHKIQIKNIIITACCFETTCLCRMNIVIVF